MNTDNIIEFTLVGAQPLMVSNPQGVDPRNPLSKQLKLLTAKRRKTEEDHELIERLKFEMSLYFDETIGPYLPAYNVLASAIEAARLSKSGRTLERGVVIYGEERLKIEYKGPRSIQAMWEAGLADIRPALASGRAILASRALFRDWKVSGAVMVDRSLVEPREFLAFLVRAGQIIGIGTYRRRFGRFTTWQRGVEIGHDGVPLNSKRERLAA